MSYDIFIVLFIIFSMLILFIGEWIPSDLVAILGMLSFSFFGILTPKESISGFSNPATITVMLMFVLSQAVAQTGGLNVVAKWILKTSNRSKFIAIFLLFLLTSLTSMFINNTAAVAILIPCAIQIARKTRTNPSSILMPLSFISMAAGVCTLIGTSTNLLANDILIDKGYSGFKMFDFFLKGSIFLLITMAYVYFFRRFLLKNRYDKIEDLDPFKIEKYITHVKIKEESLLVGRGLNSLNIKEDGIKVLSRDECRDPEIKKIQAGDLLLVQTNLENLRDFASSNNVEILPSLDFSNYSDEIDNRVIVEAVISPYSKIISTKLSEIKLFQQFGIKVLALRQGKKIMQVSLNNLKMYGGDALLLAIPRRQLERVRSSNIFHVIKEPDLSLLKINKIKPTLLILTGVVLAASFSIVPIYIAAFFGICALVLFKIMGVEEVYESINWKIIFLLAGLISVGHAMEVSGTTAYLSELIFDLVGDESKFVVVTVFFVATLLLTSIISNNASIVIMTPLAIELSKITGMSVHNLVLCVMFASSMCFLTPIGYQTNIMVMGAGHYRFFDYIRFGGPLALLLALVSGFIFY